MASSTDGKVADGFGSGIICAFNSAAARRSSIHRISTTASCTLQTKNLSHSVILRQICTIRVVEAVLTCERATCSLAGSGAGCDGRLVESELSLHRELWDSRRELFTALSPDWSLPCALLFGGDGKPRHFYNCRAAAAAHR